VQGMVTHTDGRTDNITKLIGTFHDYTNVVTMHFCSSYRPNYLWGHLSLIRSG